MNRLLLVAATLLLAPGPGCARRARPAAAACPRETHAFLERNAERYRQSIAAARRFMDGLVVDPVALRAAGMKGKKKLVELIDGYYRLVQIAGPAERGSLRLRLERVTAVTQTDAYHDLVTVDDVTFKQDSTSYLRAALLMERLGLDTRRYREEIRKVHPRLNAHMTQRGAHQRHVFHWYYRHFGLKEPFPLAGALKGGYIARRADPAAMTVMEAYHFTHEIFGPFEFGEKLDVTPFGPDDLRYLREVLEHLIPKYVAARNSDLVAELVSCVRYLRLVGLPAYRDGLAFLLESQNADGSWGSAQRALRRYGDANLAAVTQLHNVTVAVDALSVAFHPPWNHALYAPCRR